MSRVVVIGSGVAGTAAALSARAAGADVTLVRGASGASALGVGAFDDTPWERARKASKITAECTQILTTLGGITSPEGGALLASSSGILRPARAHDDALLDLASLPPGRVLVLEAPLSGWDASALARAFNAASARRELSFEVLSGAFTKHVDERAMTFAELAGRHDDPARLAWLGAALRDALARTGPVVAVLTPPLLGADRSRAAELSALVGVRCGEALAPFSSPSGRRFEASRDRALDRAGIATTLGWCKRVTCDARATVELEEGPSLEADAVVLATGGLLGGGILYTPAEAILATAVPPYPRRVFASSVDAPVVIGANDRELLVPGSMFGLSIEQIAWPFAHDPLMARVGVLCDADLRASARVYAAGDLLADRPRTWLDALTTGAKAGRSAAQAAGGGKI